MGKSARPARAAAPSDAAAMWQRGQGDGARECAGAGYLEGASAGQAFLLRLGQMGLVRRQAP